jgi:glycosyltransferase involved in cell wall biosynthesis
MRVLFVADGRSPIALNWIRYFVEAGDEVFLASTFACAPDLSLNGLEITPVAFSQARGRAQPSAGDVSGTLRVRVFLRRLLGPLTVARSSRRLREFTERIRPELVHAMRIPFEGMLAADAGNSTPVLVSIWGNDLTLHAPSTRLMRHYTSWTLQVASALHTDCRRDLRLAHEWGFAAGKPALVVPGAGGVRTEIFFASETPPRQPIVVNARGSRSYVRTSVFLQAVPLVLERLPAARFRCAALAKDRAAAAWVKRLNVGHAVQLLPSLPQAELADLFRSAQVMVSPSVHDGTPNSLLEGMACGCLPVAGDLESVREWIKPGENGLLVDPSDPRALADGIIRGLEDADLRRTAAGLNHELILERAEFGRCMSQARVFYSKVMSAS